MATCPRCEKSQIDRRDGQALAECRACHLVFDPDKPRPMQRRRVATPEVEGAPERDYIDAPPGMTAIETRGTAQLSYRRRADGRPTGVEIHQTWADLHGHHAGMLWVGLVFSVGLAVFGHFGAFVKRGVDQGPFALTFGVVMAVLVAYGLATVYWNATVVAVEDGWLTVKHGPLPWPGGTRVEAERVEQLYTEHHFFRDRSGRESHWYAVMVLLRGESRPKTLGQMTAADQAVYIEKTVERVLGIEDVPVPGELGYRQG